MFYYKHKPKRSKSYIFLFWGSLAFLFFFCSSISTRAQESNASISYRENNVLYEKKQACSSFWGGVSAPLCFLGTTMILIAQVWGTPPLLQDMAKKDYTAYEKNRETTQVHKAQSLSFRKGRNEHYEAYIKEDRKSKRLKTFEKMMKSTDGVETIQEENKALQWLDTLFQIEEDKKNKKGRHLLAEGLYADQNGISELVSGVSWNGVTCSCGHSLRNSSGTYGRTIECYTSDLATNINATYLSHLYGDAYMKECFFFPDDKQNMLVLYGELDLLNKAKATIDFLNITLHGEKSIQFDLMASYYYGNTNESSPQDIAIKDHKVAQIINDGEEQYVVYYSALNDHNFTSFLFVDDSDLNNGSQSKMTAIALEKNDLANNETQTIIHIAGAAYDGNSSFFQSITSENGTVLTSQRLNTAGEEHYPVAITEIGNITIVSGTYTGQDDNVGIFHWQFLDGLFWQGYTGNEYFDDLIKDAWYIEKLDIYVAVGSSDSYGYNGSLPLILLCKPFYLEHCLYLVSSEYTDPFINGMTFEQNGTRLYLFGGDYDSNMSYTRDIKTYIDLYPTLAEIREALSDCFYEVNFTMSLRPYNISISNHVYWSSVIESKAYMLQSETLEQSEFSHRALCKVTSAPTKTPTNHPSGYPTWQPILLVTSDPTLQPSLSPTTKSKGGGNEKDFEKSNLGKGVIGGAVGVVVVSLGVGGTLYHLKKRKAEENVKSTVDLQEEIEMQDQTNNTSGENLVRSMSRISLRDEQSF